MNKASTRSRHQLLKASFATLALMLTSLAGFGVSPAPADSATISPGTPVTYSQSLGSATSSLTTNLNANSAGAGFNFVYVNHNAYDTVPALTGMLLDCHSEVTGAQCPGYPQSVSDAGNPLNLGYASTLTYDQSTGLLYAWVQETAGAGFTDGVVALSIDPTATNPFVSFTPTSTPGTAQIYDISLPAQIGTSWYAFQYDPGASTSNGTQMMCFDLATQSACANQPYSFNVGTGSLTIPASYSESPLAIAGSKIVVPVSTDAGSFVGCFDAATLTDCAGSWPISAPGDFTAGGQPSTQGGYDFPSLDSSGQTNGFCFTGTTSDSCVDLTGASVPTPAGLSAAIPAALAASQSNEPSFVGTKEYVPLGQYTTANTDAVGCYDFATSASCAPIYPVTLPNTQSIYSAQPEADNPSCLWILGQGGSVPTQTMDVNGGNCGPSTPATFSLSKFYEPASQCAPQDYATLSITSPVPSSYSGGTATFEDANGAPVATIPTQQISADGTVDLSSLALQTTTATQVVIDLPGASVLTVGVALTWHAAYAPACQANGELANGYTLAQINSPTVTSVSPASGLNTGGQTLTLTGYNFTAATQVYFIDSSSNTVTCTDVQVLSPTTLTCTIGAGASGPADIHLANFTTNLFGSTPNAYTFTTPVVNYTAYFAPGTGIGARSPITASGQITLPDSTGMTAPTGYTFANWSDGTSTYPAGSSYTLHGDITFTAQWTALPSETLTFDPGAGSGSVAPQTVLQGSSVTVPGSTGLTPPTGYVFSGWSDGTSTYQPGSSYTVTSNTTLTAQWSLVPVPQVTLSFSAGTGSGSIFARTVNQGTAVTLPDSTGLTAPSGYAFAGWSDGTTTYQPGDSYTVSSDSTLTAQWSVIPVPQATLSFSPGTGSGSVPSQTVNQGNVVLLPDATGLTAPSGYTFAGWTNGATTYQPGTQFALTADTTLTATWSLIPVPQATLSFNPGTGSGSVAFQTVNQGASTTLPGPTGLTAPSGYAFGGWSDGTSTYQPGTAFTVNTDTTLTAVWAPIPPTQVTLSFSPGTGSGSVASQTVNQGSSVTLPGSTGLTAPTGYQFNGWNCNGTTYQAGDSLTLNTDTTCTAQWSPLPPIQVTLSFTPGTGSGSVASRTVNQGTSFNLPDSTGMTAPAGYTFGGWTDGTSTYQAGTSYTVSSNVTLTAVWNHIRVTITFQPGSGTGSIASQTVNQGSSVTLPGSTGMTAPSGYTFAGWSDGNSTYLAGTSYTVNSNTTLTAQWSLIPVPQVTLSFSHGTGSGSIASQTVNQGSTITLPDATGMTAPSGYTFAGWSDGVATFQPGTSYIVNATTTLTATWSLIPVTQVTLSFAAGSGSGSIPSRTVNQGTSVTLPSSTGLTAPIGYTFGGWTDGTSTYQAGTSYTVSSNVTLTAVWQSIPRETLSFSPGSGSGSIAPQTVNQGTSVTLPSSAGLTAPSGYVFGGWTDGTSTYQAGTSYTVSSNVTLTAVWNHIRVTITFQPGTGSGSIAPQTVNQGSSITLPGSTGLTAPSGYAFGGWSDGTNTYATGASYTVNASTTLTAVWDIVSPPPPPAQITVSFSPGTGGSGSVAPQTVTAGSPDTLPGALGLTAPTGDRFSGWSCGGVTYLPGNTFTPAANVTCVAQWVVLPTYTITFSPGTGTGSVAPITTARGSAIELPAATGMSKTGCSFVGWSSGASTYTAMTTYTPSTSSTLVAQWGRCVNKTVATVLFTRNSALLTPAAKAILASLVHAMRTQHETIVTITTTALNPATSVANKTLAKNRALAVESFLLAQLRGLGIHNARVAVVTVFTSSNTPSYWRVSITANS